MDTEKKEKSKNINERLSKRSAGFGPKDRRIRKAQAGLSDIRAIIGDSMPERINRSNRQPDSLIMRYLDSLKVLKEKREERGNDDRPDAVALVEEYKKDVEDTVFWMHLTYKKLIDACEKYLTEKDHTSEDVERITGILTQAKEENRQLDMDEQ